jgi:hypothetical protein
MSHIGLTDIGGHFPNKGPRSGTAEPCPEFQNFPSHRGVLLEQCPPVLSMWLQTVKFIAKKSKCASLAQEIDFSAPNSCSLTWLVKGTTQLCTSKIECSKLDLTAAQYFSLVDHNDWSRWFAISSSYVYAVPITVLLVGLPGKKQLNLDT